MGNSVCRPGALGQALVPANFNYIPKNRLNYDYLLEIYSAHEAHDVLINALEADDADGVLEYYRNHRHAFKTLNDNDRYFKMDKLLVAAISGRGLIRVLHAVLSELPWVFPTDPWEIVELITNTVSVYTTKGRLRVFDVRLRIRAMLAVFLEIAYKFDTRLLIGGPMEWFFKKIQVIHGQGMFFLADGLFSKAQDDPAFSRLTKAAPSTDSIALTVVHERIRNFPWFPKILFTEMSRRKQSASARLLLMKRLKPRLEFTDNADSLWNSQTLTCYAEHAAVMTKMFLVCGARDIEGYFRAHGDVSWIRTHFGPYYAFCAPKKGRNPLNIPVKYSPGTARSLFVKDNHAFLYFAVFNFNRKTPLIPEIIKMIVDYLY